MTKFISLRLYSWLYLVILLMIAGGCGRTSSDEEPTDTADTDSNELDTADTDSDTADTGSDTTDTGSDTTDTDSDTTDTDSDTTDNSSNSIQGSGITSGGGTAKGNQYNCELTVGGMSVTQATGSTHSATLGIGAVVNSAE